MANVLAVNPTKPKRNRKFSDERLVELHSQSMSARKLAKHLGVSRASVCSRMKKLGLKAKCKRGGVPRYKKVGSERFQCLSCTRVKPLRQRRGTICVNCRHERYVSTREGALRFRYDVKKADAKRKGIPFNLSYQDFKRQFEEQGGKDGYTGEQMSFDFGQGLSGATMTLDRIDNDGGYTRENVMFCRLSTNAKKGNRPVSRLIAQLQFNFSSEANDASQPESKENS